MTGDVQDRYIVPGLERGLRLLQLFTRENRVMTAPELVRQMGLPRSTVFRLLTTLETLGFIERVESSHSYRLGMPVLSLGFEYLASLELTELGTPLLQKLRDEIGCSCNLVVRNQQDIVYVAKVTAPTLFPSAATLGSRLPAHATVLGRIMLSDLTDLEFDALYPRPELDAVTPNTPICRETLRQMVREDAKRGYATATGFYEPSISSVAAPVRDHTRRIVAAVGAAIPANMLEQDQFGDLIQHVISSANELSRLLNYSEAATPDF